jgi:hypothetical protein
MFKNILTIFVYLFTSNLLIAQNIVIRNNSSLVIKNLGTSITLPYLSDMTECYNNNDLVRDYLNLIKTGDYKNTSTLAVYLKNDVLDKIIKDQKFANSLDRYLILNKYDKEINEETFNKINIYLNKTAKGENNSSDLESFSESVNKKANNIISKLKSDSSIDLSLKMDKPIYVSSYKKFKNTFTYSMIAKMNYSIEEKITPVYLFMIFNSILIHNHIYYLYYYKIYDKSLDYNFETEYNNEILKKIVNLN